MLDYRNLRTSHGSSEFRIVLSAFSSSIRTHYRKKGQIPVNEPLEYC